MIPEERDALRRGCALAIGGPHEFPPGADLIAAGEWCKANGHAPDRYGEGPLVAAFEGKIAASITQQIPEQSAQGTSKCPKDKFGEISGIDKLAVKLFVSLCHHC